ncbi:MAG TPA: isocitrate/isopropylmalate family dehydrogenase, partial [Ilumatobacteraceae bacterium]|nr:isocitrate/isopropylmalate family dehydrogenase [Ilumatobacteraceae bacterium]
MNTGEVLSRVRGRVRTQWLALGAALVVLAGVLVAWGLSQAAARVEVVQVARPVAAGQPLTADDLTVTGVAYDSGVSGLVPASSLDRLVGRVAAVDLQRGALVQVGMWSDEPALLDGEDRVGAVLAAGNFPAGLHRGDVAVAAGIDSTTATTPVVVRVIDSAVEFAYKGERRIAWKEVLAGEKAFQQTNNWLPDETVEAFREYLV